MSRERKTIDVWRLYVDYGFGWEHELDEYTPSEARLRLREYNENCPQYPAKIVRGRERIEKQYYYGAQELNGHRPACCLLREEHDPEGKFMVVYVYGRPLDQKEEREAGLSFIDSVSV